MSVWKAPLFALLLSLPAAAATAQELPPAGYPPQEAAPAPVAPAPVMPEMTAPAAVSMPAPVMEEKKEPAKDAVKEHKKETGARHVKMKDMTTEEKAAAEADLNSWFQGLSLEKKMAIKARGEGGMKPKVKKPAKPVEKKAEVPAEPAAPATPAAPDAAAPAAPAPEQMPAPAAH